jgi:tRNA 2-thiouridine synthesizing protein A
VTGPVSQINVDSRGLRCPLPVIHLATAARDAPAGTRIIVLASDPAARYDIPAWCRMRDHELSEVTEVSEPSVSEPSGYLRFVVVVRAQSSKAAGAGSGSDRPSRPT